MRKSESGLKEHKKIRKLLAPLLTADSKKILLAATLLFPCPHIFFLVKLM
jgi:hypothetical protein